MATIKYLLQSKLDNAPIYLRLSIGRGNTIKRKTGLNINPKDWSKTTGLPKQNNSDNKNLTTDLKGLETFVIKNLNDSTQKGVEINGHWLKNTIDIKFKRVKENRTNESVIFWINYIVNNAHLKENAKGNYGLSKSRINSYKGLLTTIKEYQGKNTIQVKDLSKKEFDKIKKWLFETKKYSPTTAIKKLTDLQKVVKEAKENNIPIANDYIKVKFKKVSAYDDDMDIITLTLDDISKIEEADLKKEALINARKWLILACYTGQRGGALTKRLVESNFEKYGSDLIIKIKQKKGNKPVSIPVLPKVKEIYNTGLPYPISTQKLNKHFKEICEIAKIDEPILGTIRDKETNRNLKKSRPKHKYISSHTGRRTFATLHYNKISTPIIMRVTGHTKESTFLEYINQNHDDHLETFLDYYKTKEQKEKKESNLTLVKKAN